MLTAQRLRSALSYDRKTGIFRWKISRRGAVAGAVTGTPTYRGYLHISIDRRVYSAGRLAWLYVTGKWPASGINYINGVRSDIRWANLREATHSQCRAISRTKNKLGARGVWLSKSDRYVAQIRIHGQAEISRVVRYYRRRQSGLRKSGKKALRRICANMTTFLHRNSIVFER